MKTLVQKYVPLYEASPRDKKSSVVGDLIAEWRSLTGGQFRKRKKETGDWRVLSNVEAAALVQTMLLRNQVKSPAHATADGVAPADQGAAVSLLDLSSSARASAPDPL